MGASNPYGLQVNRVRLGNARSGLAGGSRDSRANRDRLDPQPSRIRGSDAPQRPRQSPRPRPLGRRSSRWLLCLRPAPSSTGRGPGPRRTTGRTTASSRNRNTRTAYRFNPFPSLPSLPPPPPARPAVVASKNPKLRASCARVFRRPPPASASASAPFLRAMPRGVAPRGSAGEIGHPSESGWALPAQAGAWAQRQAADEAGPPATSHPIPAQAFGVSPGGAAGSRHNHEARRIHNE